MTSTLTHAEREALAILLTGGSFDEAAKHSGLSIEQVQQAWNSHGERR